jgi:dUTP pyrophosphatase
MNIPIINKSHHPLPAYQTDHAAAMDAIAFLQEPVTLQPLERALIPTGLFFALPVGYEMQVRSRSGLSVKHGVVCINSPGTIDADYRGELKLLMANLSNEAYTIHDGDRLAQLVVAKCERIEWEPVEALNETARGEGGIGHTGRW